MNVLLDVTRTLVHARKRTPTGIDRVEHAYVRYLLKYGDPRKTWFVANTPLGRGALSCREMAEIFKEIERRQEISSPLEMTSTFSHLVSVLSSPVGAGRTSPLSIRQEATRDKDSRMNVLRAFLRGARRFSALMREKRPTLYLHTSHLQLDEPHCFRWLSQPHLFPAFFIHDLIPIEFPEYCSPGATARHEVRMQTALRHARALILNSAFTRDSLISYAGADRLPPASVVPLANTIREFSAENDPVITPAAPYFVHVGTIEGRKNIGHLLNVWRHVIAVMGRSDAPRLVIVGRRGWECETAASILDRSRELADHVIEVSNINDRELRSLMRQACGLVTVSITEGYGLPPVEAARLGVPVIASDIPAHREILGAHCVLVPVHDGEALARAIMAVARGEQPGKDTPEIQPFTWDDHVRSALSFLEARFRANGCGVAVEELPK